MGYYMRYGRYRREYISSPEIEKTLEDLLKCSDLTDWERSFVSSLPQSYKKYGGLTPKQNEIVQRMAKKLDPNFLASRKAWRENYGDEHRENMKIMAHYYKANPPYFSDLAASVLNGDDFTPTQKQYAAMCENKYATKVIAMHKSPPAFPAGTMVMIRNNQHTQLSQHLRPYRNKLAMVISVSQDITMAARGSRGMTILPVGSTTPIETQERCIKKARV